MARGRIINERGRHSDSMASNDRACGLLQLNPDRSVIAKARVAQGRPRVYAPDQDSTFGVGVGENVIELISVAVWCEEGLLLLGEEPRSGSRDPGCFQISRRSRFPPDDH